jgi:aryl-alcohol dehydrogenase-like predicted oxidoreductase
MSRRADPALSRREFLGAGVALGVGTLLSGALPAAASQGLLTRVIPSSGERIPVIGLGTDAFREQVRDEIRAEIKRMSELGGSVIDTAAAYGDSEALIGDALASLRLRDRMFLATKLVGGGGAENSGASGADSFARSLERLKTRSIDLLQVHNLNGLAALLPTMQEWKKAGKIRYIGVTTSRGSQHAEMLEAMRTYPLDFIQVDYSIANRDAAEAILPLAQERKLAVLINLPFGRSSLFRQVADRALPPWAADIDVRSWAQYFLKYVISQPAVTCVIPGSTQVSHLEDNQAAGRGRLPDAAMRRRMEEYWDSKS